MIEVYIMKKLFPKRNVLLSLAASISLCFTLFFFSPVDLFIANQKEFTVGASHIILPMLLFSIGASAIMFSLLLIIGAASKKLFDGAVCLVFGTLLAVYCQILLFNGKMQLIDGGETDYSKVSIFNYFNIAVLYVLLFVPLVILYAKKRSKGSKLRFINMKSFLFASALIVVMQAFGTGSLLVTHGIKKANDSKRYEYLSFEPVLSMSKENNIIVILLDRLDTEWMSNTLERYPEMEGKLDGFTFYKDNVSRYFSTYPSVPQMLTGVEFTKDHRDDFAKYVWEQENVPDKLKANGFDINLVIDKTTTFSSYSQLEDVSRNCNSLELDLSFNYLGDEGIVRTMLRLSAAKTLPYFFKWIITDEMSFDFSNSFTYLDYEKYNYILRPVISPETDLDFYKYLQKHYVTADSNSPCFTFIHLNGPHDPDEAISNQYNGNSYGVDEESTIRGDFESIFLIFDQMKELGIYDNSTIIILGDHGRFREVQNQDLITRNINTGLLIKPRSENGKFSIDTTTQMSLQYFPASIMEYAGLDHSEYGCSFNDVIRDNIKTDRYTSLLIYEDTLYRISGSALDFNNWEAIERDPNRKKKLF